MIKIDHDIELEFYNMLKQENTKNVLTWLEQGKKRHQKRRG